MKLRPFVIFAVLPFGLFACSHLPELKPDPAAPRAPGNPNLAFVEDAGVRVYAAGDTWQGDPKDLAKVFTPVQVTIENQSGRVLRIGYTTFKLVGSSGFAYAAIPPLQARATISQAPRGSVEGTVLLAAYEQHPATGVPNEPRPPIVVTPRIRHEGFYIALHYAWYYPGWTAWGYPYPYDPLYYERMYAYWPEQLPTQDMLAEALPSGAVQNGGHISGYIYFQGLKSNETRANFEMDLVDAASNQAFGHVVLPFDVKK